MPWNGSLGRDHADNVFATLGVVPDALYLALPD